MTVKELEFYYKNKEEMGMKIIGAIKNIDDNVIILISDLYEYFEFNMNEREALPKWANEEFEKLTCIIIVENFMFFHI